MPEGYTRGARGARRSRLTSCSAFTALDSGSLDAPERTTPVLPWLGKVWSSAEYSRDASDFFYVPVFLLMVVSSTITIRRILGHKTRLKFQTRQKTIIMTISYLCRNLRKRYRFNREDEKQCISWNNHNTNSG
ncbi:hypothetical protein DM02DRAFT_616326 [Periconia macrospinosa]|uniref:Uncharacterized protein n=1 Tax=Periconia macrospinosa TaxID=97972 RepID=A0A2V1DHT0_9PLEO|nr:hypothetical protein DM02DRAFT_616326 [Periconia macrospinosa]